MPEPHDPTPSEGIAIIRPKRRLRRSLQVAAVIVLLMVGYYGLTLWQVHTTGASDQRRPVDAIVVLGAAQYDGRPSPVLAARLDHAAVLWAEGLAPFVVVTGGQQPGDRFTEAEASIRYLVGLGIPESAILSEDQGRNTYDSLVAVADLLAERDLSHVLLVTDPYHSLRARLISQDLGLTAYVSPTRTSPVQGGDAFAREVREAAGIAVARIIGFERLLSITG